MAGTWNERLLSQGGFGEVFLFQHENTGRQLAIKVPLEFTKKAPEDVKKILDQWNKECEMMLTLDHPNVVKTYQVPEEIAAKFDIRVMAMEHCSKGSLRMTLNQPENCYGLTELEVLSVIRHISAGIEYLHQQNIVHRDIKPENILLSCSIDSPDTITYKLCDVGLAKDLTDGETTLQTCAGTLCYLAPEICLSKKYDEKVDYWSFGVVVSECVIGEHPFLTSADDVKQMIKQKELYYANKKSTHLYGRLVKDKPPTFQTSFLKTHQLNSELQMLLEQWLRLLLEFDPEKRGGGCDENGRLKCHVHLQNIVNLKFGRIFFPFSNELRSYIVHSESRTMNGERPLRQYLPLLKVKPAQLENYILLSARGELVSPDERAASFAHSYEQNEDDMIVHVIDCGHYTPAGIPPVPAELNNLTQSISFPLGSQFPFERRMFKQKLFSLFYYFHKLERSVKLYLNAEAAVNKWINKQVSGLDGVVPLCETNSTTDIHSLPQPKTSCDLQANGDNASAAGNTTGNEVAPETHHDSPLTAIKAHWAHLVNFQLEQHSNLHRLNAKMSELKIAMKADLLSESNGKITSKLVTLTQIHRHLIDCQNVWKEIMETACRSLRRFVSYRQNFWSLFDSVQRSVDEDVSQLHIGQSSSDRQNGR